MPHIGHYGITVIIDDISPPSPFTALHLYKDRLPPSEEDEREFDESGCGEVGQLRDPACPTSTSIVAAW